jgi:general secretion pathway protein G
MKISHTFQILLGVVALAPIPLLAEDQSRSHDEVIKPSDLKAAIKVVNQVEKDLRDITVQIEVFRMMNGRFPTTEEGIRPLVERPEAAPKWLQLLKCVPTDPWGRPYCYALKDAVRGTYDLYSRGPDLQDTGAEIHAAAPIYTRRVA